MENETQLNNSSNSSPSATQTPASPQLKQSKMVIYILLEIVIVALSLYAGIQIGKNQTVTQNPVANKPTATPTQVVTSPTAQPTETKVSTLTSIDGTWNLYSNNSLGFSIKVPKIIAGETHNNCPSDYAVPTAVYDDDTGAYITNQYFYEYPQNGICSKTANSLDVISQRANQWKNNVGTPLFVPSNWHIITAKAENDTELETFIKANYGTSCKLGTKSLSPTGVYDVKIQGDNLGPDVSQCHINFVYALKYSPEKHKVATWGVGQEVVFSSPDHKQGYHSEMINSFTFTD